MKKKLKTSAVLASKDKRPIRVRRRKKLPATRPGVFEFYGVWGLGPNERFSQTYIRLPCLPHIGSKSDLKKNFRLEKELVLHYLSYTTYNCNQSPLKKEKFTVKTYHQNGTVSEVECLLSDDSPFGIQFDKSGADNIIFYPGDNVVSAIDAELVILYDRFVNIYFSDLNAYYQENARLPIGLAVGGQSSEIAISKDQFLKLANQCKNTFTNIYKHIYVGDCQYLVSTVQNLLQSVEYCFVQYYIQIVSIDCLDLSLGKEIMSYSKDTANLAFLLETFFTKLHSILDLMVKIIYELENPADSFPALKKLKGSDKLWGDRKLLSINNLTGTIFENCELLRQIDSVRDEAIHNGAWEYFPKVFLRVVDMEIVERYMLFPDFENGRLAAAKNRRHFFSEGTKVNDVLVSIHHEFYQRLLATLQYINGVQT